MFIIHKIAGAMLGIVTGIITTLFQIPHAYYLFAQTMTREGFRWPVTLVATLTLGHLAVLNTLVGIVVNAPSTLLVAMQIGWREGLLSTIQFPYTFNVWFQHQLYRITNLNVGDGIFSPKGWFLRLISVLSAFALGGTTYYKLYNDPNYQRIISDLSLYNKIMYAIFIRPPAEATPSFQPSLGLSNEDVKIFEQAIHANPDHPQYEKNLSVLKYLKSEDPISYATPTEIQLPVTEEFINNQGESKIVTYEYDAFYHAFRLEAAKVQCPLADKDGRPLVRELLTPSQVPAKQAIIYNGFYKKLDIEHVHRVVQTWKSQITKPETMTRPSNSENKKQNELTFTSKDTLVAEARARNGFLNALAKRNQKPDTAVKDTISASNRF